MVFTALSAVPLDKQLYIQVRGKGSSSCAVTVMSVCNISFVDLLLFLFGVFGGLCDVNSCNVFLLLFMGLWVPISATLFRRAVLTL
jgi:hypothetical protein